MDIRQCQAQLAWWLKAIRGFFQQYKDPSMTCQHATSKGSMKDPYILKRSLSNCDGKKGVGW